MHFLSTFFHWNPHLCPVPWQNSAMISVPKSHPRDDSGSSFFFTAESLPRLVQLAGMDRKGHIGELAGDVHWTFHLSTFPTAREAPPSRGGQSQRPAGALNSKETRKVPGSFSTLHGHGLPVEASSPQKNGRIWISHDSRLSIHQALTSMIPAFKASNLSRYSQPFSKDFEDLWQGQW